MSVRPVAVWRITALELPRVLRRCPRCDVARAFVSSGCFRVNAQKRRLDVWLVHRCSACDETWNAPIAERVTPESLGADLERFHANDDALARRLAFAVPGADCDVAFAVERPPVVGPCVVRLRLVDRVSVRLDRLLARELGISRAAARALDARRRVVDGLEIPLYFSDIQAECGLASERAWVVARRDDDGIRRREGDGSGRDGVLHRQLGRRHR